LDGGFESEEGRRREALRLVAEEGMGVQEAAAAVGRTRRWLTKWKQRDDAGESLQGRSTAPRTQPTKTSEEVVDLVLEYRDRLEADPVASIGGLSIVAAMERDDIENAPSVRTVERILTDAGRTRQPKPPSGRSSRLPLPSVGSTPGVWQQSDWIHDRYLVGGAVFNSLTISDVGSKAICAGQYVHRTVLNAVTLLIEDAWPTMSIPQAMSVDNAFARTTHPNNPWTLWTRACLFFGVEVVVSPPGELGWTNHVESDNHLWQSRTISRHFCPDLTAVRDISQQACDWFNTKRPILDPTVCGTRYPAEHIDNHRPLLRWPPEMVIADHLDAKGKLNIPLSTGRITFLRRVEHETIRIAHTRWPTPNLDDGALIVASITTADRAITLQHHGEELARMPYPINKPVTEPLYQPQPLSIYHHA
jgi:hypothetical protein